MFTGTYVPPVCVVDGGMQEGYCIRGFNVKIIGNFSSQTLLWAE